MQQFCFYFSKQVILYFNLSFVLLFLKYLVNIQHFLEESEGGVNAWKKIYQNGLELFIFFGYSHTLEI